jgi:hypothetical protein
MTQKCLWYPLLILFIYKLNLKDQSIEIYTTKGNFKKNVGLEIFKLILTLLYWLLRHCGGLLKNNNQEKISFLVYLLSGLKLNLFCKFFIYFEIWNMQDCHYL